MCFCLRGFVSLFLLRNRICDTKNHGLSGECLCYEICPNNHLTTCWLSPESFSFPDQKKSDVFSPVELLMLSAWAVAHSKSRLMLSFHQWAQEQHPEPALPLWIPVSCCTEGSPLSPGALSSQGAPAAAAAVSRAGAARACREVLWAPVLLRRPSLGRPDKSVKAPFSYVIVLFCLFFGLKNPVVWGFFLPHAGTIDKCKNHQFITAKWEWFVKWKGKWHAWNYSRERDQMNNLLAEWMSVVYWGAKSKLAIWIAFRDGQVCTSLRSILLPVFAIVLNFLKQKALSAENTFSLPCGIFWISNTVDCCSTCQTCAFSGKCWECVRTMNSSSASVHCGAWTEWEPRGAGGKSCIGGSLLMLEYLQVTEPVWRPATQPLPSSPASMWTESTRKRSMSGVFPWPSQAEQLLFLQAPCAAHLQAPWKRLGLTGLSWLWLGLILL